MIEVDANCPNLPSEAEAGMARGDTEPWICIMVPIGGRIVNPKTNSIWIS